MMFDVTPPWFNSQAKATAVGVSPIDLHKSPYRDN
jgi:hypothetical protein